MMDYMLNANLENLYDVLKNAKQVEDSARQERIAIEEQIASLVPTEDIGQKTITLSDGNKITVKRSMNYRADCEKIIDCCKAAGCSFSPTKTQTTVKLDEKGYEWYRHNDPQMFGVFSKFVTVTPAKVSVTLKDK